MAQEGGYAASGQFKSIADNAASAVVNVQQLAKDFVALSAAVGGIATAVKEFGALQQTLVLTNTVAQGNAQQLAQMNQAVRDMALNYKFSANEGAQALYFLSSAGFSVGESLRAMSGVTLLAQGTLSDLAQTADTIANTISAFGLQASDSTKIANLFAAAISVTQATMDKLSYSMRYVAPVAAAMGASVEQTTVALSLLYNAGNRGQQSGTLLRDILVRLVNPSKEASEVLSQLGVAILDDSGKTRNFVDILKELSSLNLSPVTLSKIFEQRGVSGAQTLLASFDPSVFQKRLQDADFAGQVDNIAKRANVATSSIHNMFELMQTAETNTTFATKLAIEQNNTLAGSFSRAKNAITEIGITVGEQLAPGLNAVANAITSAVQSFRSMDDGTKKLITDIPILATVAFGAVKAFGGITNSVGETLKAFASYRGAINDVRQAEETLAAVQRARSQLQTFGGQNLNAVNTLAGQRLQVTSGGGPLPVGAFLRPNVPTTTQFENLERTFQQELRQFAQTQALGGVAARNAQAPVPPISATEAREGFRTAATSAAGVAIGAMGSIVSAVFGVVSLVALAAVAFPYIKEFLTAKPGTSDLGKPVEDTSKNDISAVLSTPGPNLEKLQSLQGIIDQKDTSLQFWTQALKDREEIQKKAQQSLVEYVAGVYEFNGDIKKANDVRKAGNVDMIEFLAKPQLGQETPLSADQLQAQDIFSSATFQKLKKQYDDASRAAETAITSVDNAKTYIKNVKDKQAEVRGLVSTQDEQKQRDALQNLKLQQEGDQLIVLLQSWLTGLERKSRDAQVAAAKAAADISQNPIDKYIADIVENQLKLVDKIKSASDEIAQKFNAEIGTLANNLVGGDNSPLKGQIGNILAGLSWTETLKGELLEGGVAKVQHEGLAEAIAKGLDPKEAFAQFKAGIDLVAANLSQQNPEIKAQLDRLKDLSLSQFLALIKDDQASRVKGLFTIFEQQRQNRQFIQTLKDELTTYNNQYLTALDSATGGQVPTIKLRVDFNSLNKQFGDELAKADQARLEMIKKLGGERPDISVDKLREIEQQATAFVQPTVDAATRAYVRQAQNIINAAEAAQLKVKVDAANALADTKVRQSQINDDLAGLYARMGVNIPASVFQSAAQLEFNQIDQKITAQRGQLQQEEQQLQQYLDELKAIQANPEKLQSQGAIPKAPLALVGGAAEQMQEALKRGTDIFQEAFGTKLTIFTDKFDAVLTKFLGAFGTHFTSPGVQVPALAYPNAGGLNNPGTFPSLPPVITSGSAGAGAGSGTTGGAGAPVYITNSTSLADAVAKLESNNSPIDGPSGRYANYRYQQFNGFVSQYGSGAEGVNNYAGQVLKANPNATFGDFYGGYVTGTGNPATASERSLLTTTQPGAQGAYDNLYRNSPIAPSTPLSTVLGAGSQGMDPEKVQQANQFWQQQADIITGIDASLAKMPVIQQDVNQLTAQETEQVKSQIDVTQQKIAANQQAQQTIQATADAAKDISKYPDQQAIANWQQYQKVVQDAQRGLAGSQDMIKGFQVANAQLANQVGNSAKMAADTYAAAANSIATNLTALIVGTQKDWKVALKNIATDIATTIIKALILRTLTGIGGGLFGSVGGAGASVGLGGAGITGSSKGSYYDSGMSYFASGGVVNTPTPFEFMQGASRKPGVMGEAGPEGILPLSRGPDGKLGVRLVGPITPINRGAESGLGGYNYSPNFHFYGDQQASNQPQGNDRQNRARIVSMQKDLDREMEATFMRVAQKHMRAGGIFNNSGQRLGITGQA